LLKDSLPRLYSFARNRNISVAKFPQSGDILEKFHIPLSAEAFQELQDLQAIIQGIQIQNNEADCWQYIWGSNRYSPKQFYNLPFKSIRLPSPFLWIW
jgi:hypothetical protein